MFGFNGFYDGHFYDLRIGTEFIKPTEYQYPVNHFKIQRLQCVP